MTHPVVLVHGFATSALRTWVEPGWVALLEEAGRQVVAPDILGHGTADKPTDVAAYDAVEELILEQLPTEPFDAIGYSAGGRILLVLAHRHPGRFHRLVVGGLGGSLFEEERKPFEPHVQNRFDGLIETPDNDAAALKAYRQRVHPPLTPEMVGQIQTPTLLVIGDQDFAGPGEPLVEALPNGELLTLRGVDHFGLPKNFTFLEKALEFIGAQPY